MEVSLLLQVKIQDKIKECLDVLIGYPASKHFHIRLEFSNSMGLEAGHAYEESCRIVLNEKLFLAEQENFFKQIIPHEVCHIVQFICYPEHKRAHGKEWKMLMRKLGLEPSTYHQMDVTAVDATFYRYTCSCDEGYRLYQASQRVHNNIQKGSVRICKDCCTRLVYFPRGD